LGEASLITAQWWTNLAPEQKIGSSALREFLARNQLYGGEIGDRTESEARTLLGTASLDAAGIRLNDARFRGVPQGTAPDEGSAPSDPVARRERRLPV